jgi:muramoyltetrapeptide carboxypeptidase
MQSLRKKNARRLTPLKPGDRIGIAAPASPFDRDLFLQGIDIVKKMGFEVVCPDDIFCREGYLAGTDEHRLALLHAYFADPEISAVWCARGGYGSMRLLPLLDPGIVYENPKPFIGCSDITALLNFLCHTCGIVTFHGPMITTLPVAGKMSIDFIISALTQDRPLMLSADNPEVIVSGAATGLVTGGNLSTLSHLLGTPFFPDFSGAIVFLEDVGEKPYRLDRMLTQLIFSGHLDRAAGICLGSFHNCGQNDQVQGVLFNRLSSLAIPVAAGFPAGHGMPSLTLPFGLEAVLDADEGTLCYKESAVI